MRFPVADGWRAVFGAQFVSRISKLNNRKAGYQAKVSGIEGRHRIAEMQRRTTNQQVFECDADAVSSPLSLDLSSQLGNFERHRMNRHIAAKFIGE